MNQGLILSPRIENPNTKLVRYIDQQMYCLWKNLDIDDAVDAKTVVAIERGELILPKEAIAWFVIPYWRALACSPERAEKHVRRAVRAHCNLHFARAHQSLSDRVSMRDAIIRIRARQHDANLLIIPAKFITRNEFVQNSSSNRKFNLSPTEHGAMVLTHPDYPNNRFGAIGFNPYT